MASNIVFGKPSQFRTKLVLLPKGDQIAQTQLLANHIEPSILAPFSLENPPSSISSWQGSSNFTISKFDNKLSRNMAVIRTDKIASEVSAHVKNLSGDASILLCVQNKKEAFAAGVAVSKSSPLYNKKSSKKNNSSKIFVEFLVENGEHVDNQELQNLSESIRNTQRMVDTPASELNTTEFVKEAEEIKDKLNAGSPLANVTIEIISGEELKNRNFGGIYNVGKAATKPPALVILSYLPEKAEKTIALVGKGIVYDCGGLSLKTTVGMCNMKGDMGGAAAVLNSFSAIVQNKLNVKVHALLCLAENAIGPDAFRNDDILYMYSGKTVEINNTDAEGRLVLADGVAYASRHLSPNIIVDIATLTGAQMVTTGVVHGGILTPSQETQDKAVNAGKATGDLVFPFLYAPELLMAMFESPVADMKNSATNRSNALASCAGHFIESHLHSEYKGEYLHVDIAGPSFQRERSTGFGTALLYQLAKEY